MSKLTAGELRRKRKYEELHTEKFCISDAIIKITVMLMGIMVSVLSFTECFNINCNERVIFLFTLMILVILAVIMELKRQNIILGILAFVVLIGAILLRSYLKVGILSLANAILYQYQQYYDNRHIYSFRISTEGLRWGSMYWYNTIVICAIIIEYAYVLMIATWNKIYAAVHYIFSIVFLAIPMAFGLFPPTYVVVLLVGYCILCMAFQHERRISVKKAAYLMITTLVAAGIMFICVDPKTYEEKNRFAYLKKTINHAIEKIEMSDIFTKGIFGSRSDEAIATGGLGKGKLGEADKIIFENKEMLTVTLPLPQNEVYLKGFAANNYNGKQWYYTYYNQRYNDMIDAFYWYQENSGEYYESSHEAEEAIMSQSYNYLNDFLGTENYSVFIKNLEEDGNYYIPYNAIINDRRTLQDLMVTGHNYSYNTDGLWYTCFDYSFEDYYDFCQMSKENNILIPTEESMGEAYLRYKEYVEEANLTVPDDLVRLFQELLPDAPQYDGKNIESLMSCIQYVKSYLQKNTNYSLKPGRMEGYDFVTDFLVNKKEGYCTSYASATVLMLRYMGIPARYAEGYRIGRDEILVGTYNRDTKEYTAEIKDSSAHAWAEVYVNGIGFMPVDTTPGYSTSNPNEPGTSEGETGTKGENNTTPQKESKDNKETTTKGETVSKPNSPSGKDGTIANGENSGSKNSISASVIIVVLSLTAGFLIVSVLVYLYQDKKKSGKKILNESIKRLSEERREVIIQSEGLFKLLKAYGIIYGWEKYSGEYAVEIETLLKKADRIKAERMNQRKDTEDAHMEPESQDELTALEFLKLYQQAKFSNESDEISEEDYKKVVNYVDKCKNSLQYLKK